MKKIFFALVITLTVNVYGMHKKMQSSIQINDYNSRVYEKIKTINHEDKYIEEHLRLHLIKDNKMIGESHYLLQKNENITNSAVEKISRDYFFPKENVHNFADRYSYLLFLEAIDIEKNHRRGGLASEWIWRSLVRYFKKYRGCGRMLVILRIFPYGERKLTFNQTAQLYKKLNFEPLVLLDGAKSNCYCLILDKNYLHVPSVNFGKFKTKKIESDIKIMYTEN